MRATTYWKCLTASALCIVGGNNLLAQSFNHTAIIVTGQQAPGTPAGVVYGYPTIPPLIPPILSNNGTALVTSGLAGTGVVTDVNDLGVFAVTPGGTVQYLARDGDVAPGTGGAVFDSLTLNIGNIASNGTIALSATLVTGGAVTTANNRGYWTGTPGNLQLVLRSGDVAAGTGGATFASIGAPYVSANGNIFHEGTLVQTGGVNTSNNSGVWISSLGSSTLLTREGDVAPGTGGAIFSSAFVPNFASNSTGTTAIFAGILVVGGSVTVTNNNGFWMGTPGNLQLVMRTGNVVPGMGGNVLATAGSNTIMDNGNAIVTGIAAIGGSVTANNDAGMWMGTTAANLQLVAREGDPISGLPAGVTNTVFGIPFTRGNHVMFRTTLAGTGVNTTNDSAIIYWSAATGLRLVAREGDVAPGAGGALLGAIGTASPLFFGQQPDISINGSVYFYTPLTGTGVNSTNDSALWVWNNGSLQMLIRKGTVIDLDPGAGVDNVTLTNLTTFDQTVNHSMGYKSVDDNDRFGWAASLSDGRFAAFVSAPAAIPEPMTIALMGIAGAAGVGLYLNRKRVMGMLQNQTVETELEEEGVVQ